MTHLPHIALSDHIPFGVGTLKKHCTNIGSNVAFEVPIYGNSSIIFFRVLNLQEILNAIYYFQQRHEKSNDFENKYKINY